MNPNQRVVLVTQLAEKIAARGSWSGETHIQKATYLLQSLAGVDLGFNFILYKHGPFSFDLRDALNEMRADGFIELKPKPYPYGPSLRASDIAKQLWTRMTVTAAENSDAIEFISGFVGGKNVSDLERIATAFYVTQQMKGGGSNDLTERAAEITRIKPHVSFDDALSALREVDAAIESAGQRLRAA